MITVILGDITKQHTTAIVNAANTHLLAGGGICGAIHAAAGPDLEKECLRLGGCPTGEARITSGYNLPAKFVIHAVGPKYWDGTRNEAQLLRSCYKAIFEIIKQKEISSVAIPAIGTGIYRFPIEQATAIAVEETRAAIETNDFTVIFCCFDKKTLDVYSTLINGSNGR
jgi:O-acetyl-ADP-ribose deacetylase (regulator of RNase III)